jgi:hypothetical protein
MPQTIINQVEYQCEVLEVTDNYIKIKETMTMAEYKRRVEAGLCPEFETNLFGVPATDSPLKLTGDSIEEHFNQAWAAYPRKLGRKAALKSFKSSVKNRNDFSKLLIAINHYAESVKGKEEQFIKHGNTFFNNWQDYYDLASQKNTSLIQDKSEGGFKFFDPDAQL